MAISKTDLVNKALTLVGGAPIVNLATDNTNNSRIANRVYELSLRSLLSECKWNFATKRSLLSLVSTGGTLAWYDSGETYLYTKPSDMIKVFEASVEGATYREEGDYIVSDTSSLGLRYVYYLDDPTKYSAQFMDAFTDKLCSDMAYMIVNSSSLGDKYKQIYEGVSLPKAMASNSQVGTQQTMKDDSWELAKYSNSRADA